MYSITQFDPNKPFAADEFRETPQEAIDFAIASSMGHQASICSDARNWADFRDGNLIRRREWDDFYTSEPSEEYEALRVVLDKYPVVKSAKGRLPYQVGSGRTTKRIVWHCMPPLFGDHEWVLASATDNHGSPETLLFESDAKGTWGREVSFGSRRVFDLEAALKEEGYTCSMESAT